MDKKITDLQLRSNVNEDVNFAADDGIQTYRVTAPQVEAFVYGKNQTPNDIQNYSLACSVGSSALTIALKTAAGGNPTAATPVRAAFKNATAATGVAQIGLATAATSLVVSSGSKVGTTDGVAKYLYVYAMNNAGSIELAVSGKQWDEGSRQSSTAEGGAGAADAGDVLYSTTTRSNLGIRLIARLKVTQTTAGTWAAVPTEISLPPFKAGPFLWTGYLTGTSIPFQSASTSFVDFSNSGESITITELLNNGFGVVDVYGGVGMSGKPGLVFTPPEAGFYEVKASFGLNSISSGSNYIGVRLADLTNSKIGDEHVVFQTVQHQYPVTLCGIFYFDSIPTTISIQQASQTGGNVGIYDPQATLSLAGPCVSWTLKKVMGG